ncbi:hypothetical protein SAMN05446037_104927 [Anaerovirgula multivorans]|uniref:DUF2313 domain-containing protein n=2 Tax=Anaerovirgula multivorans TaxID=312168 RepID=A0A239KL66_9FIRM|nr:hypothetical protein SAMN05446037_104927 [Anaerovirgula multivorans]
MIGYLPTYERKSKVFQEIMKAAAKEVDQEYVDIKSLSNQLLINTATWGLAIYEQELGIQTDINKSYEERRNAIIAKWRGIGKVDKNLIQLITESYAVGDVSVVFNHAITIYLLGVNETMIGMKDLLNSIEEIKPAHLRLQIIYVYITYGELSPSTYGDLRSFTYRQIKNHDF